MLSARLFRIRVVLLLRLEGVVGVVGFEDAENVGVAIKIGRAHV